MIFALQPQVTFFPEIIDCMMKSALLQTGTQDFNCKMRLEQRKIASVLQLQSNLQNPSLENQAPAKLSLDVVNNRNANQVVDFLTCSKKRTLLNEDKGKLKTTAQSTSLLTSQDKKARKGSKRKGKQAPKIEMNFLDSIREIELMSSKISIDEKIDAILSKRRSEDNSKKLRSSEKDNHPNNKKKIKYSSQITDVDFSEENKTVQEYSPEGTRQLLEQTLLKGTKNGHLPEPTQFKDNDK